MERRKITIAGQVSVPSRLRRRWDTQILGFEDKGDHAEIWPLPDDPIGAARGALKGRIGPTKGLRAAARQDEGRAEARRR
jgi:bifunctional DNA-binding transcriptional regulator/antitoxin component of YhaV-PrlF toxin-antitoxin module